MRHRILSSICLGVIIAVLIGLVLHSPYSKREDLCQSYQRVSPIVVTVRGDRLNDWDPNNIVGVGTGFFIDEKYVLTVAHIINSIDANTVELRLWDEQIISAQLIAKDDANDLALLQIDPNDIKTYEILELNFRTDPQIGEMVFIIGSPYLFNNTMTKGIFSRGTTIDKDPRWFFKFDIYLVDAFVEGGSSGSPVFNVNLKVIGIVTGYCGKLSVVIPAYSIVDFLIANKVYYGK